MSDAGPKAADPDRLFRLLPPYLQARDLAAGQSLRALLRLVGEQFRLIEDDIAHLYEDWFVETCDPRLAWLVGGPVGYEPAAGPPTGGVADPTDPARDRRRTLLLSPRREVANLLRSRRRKGTPGVLEELARDVSGYPALAVELRATVLCTPHANHARPGRDLTPDAGDGEALQRGLGPSSVTARTMDARRIGSNRTRGRGQLDTVAVYLWRLRPYHVGRIAATPVDNPFPASVCHSQDDRFYFTFSPLKVATRLFQRPSAEIDSTRCATEADLPVPIRRRPFLDRTADFYGPGKSLLVWYWDEVAGALRAYEVTDVVAADLSSAATARRLVLRAGQVGIDPERGLLAVSGATPPRLWVTYHYGFTGDLGGGSYERCPAPAPAGDTPHVYVRTPPPGPATPAKGGSATPAPEGVAPGSPEAPFPTIRAAFEAQPGWTRLVVEILDDAAYDLPGPVVLGAGRLLEIRSAQGRRPLVRLPAWRYGQPGTVRPPEAGPPGGRLVLDGLLVAGGPLAVQGGIESVTLRHCTLVPGLGLKISGGPESPDMPSVVWIDPGPSTRLDVLHSIVGPVSVQATDRHGDPLEMTVLESVVDNAGGQCEAIGGRGCAYAFARLTVVRSTVLGPVSVHALARAEDSIFRDPLRVARRQHGCVRFCYVPSDARGSRTPPRFQCQPDLVEKCRRQEHAAADGAGGAAAVSHPVPSPGGPCKCCGRGDVEPVFRSVRYGHPEYVQLDPDLCPDEIRRGASDTSEMGVFHDLDHDRRMDHLRVRLAEFAPVGVEVVPVVVNLNRREPRS